jgi:plastocyanin
MRAERDSLHRSTLLLMLLAAACAPAPERGVPSAPVAAAGTPSIAGNAPRGTIVSLEPTPTRAFPAPDGSAVMDQYAKQFVPELLFVRVGQPVEFRNSEDSPHNVNVNRVPTGTAVFSTSTAPYQKYTHTFDQPGQYAVSCDLHAGMQATVVVTTTPYVAVADASGAFSFVNLEPGAYTLAWVTNGQSGTKRIEVTGSMQVSVP